MPTLTVTSSTPVVIRRRSLPVGITEEKRICVTRGTSMPVRVANSVHANTTVQSHRVGQVMAYFIMSTAVSFLPGSGR